MTYSLHLTLSLLFVAISIGSLQKERFKLRFPPKKIQYRYYLLKQAFDSKEAHGVLLGMTTGHKKGVSRKTKEIMRSFGLLHLFTPSGLHLSSILLCFLILSKNLKKSRGLKIIMMALYLFSQSISGFDSIKRILLWRSIPANHQYLSYLFAAVLDLLIFYEWRSPLSFSFSFLFLGTILIFQRSAKIKLLAALLLNQWMIATFFGESFEPFSVLLGFGITAIMTFLFPIFFLQTTIAPFFILKEIGVIIELIITLLKDLAPFTSFISIPPSLLSFVIANAILRKQKKLFIIVLFCLLPNSMVEERKPTQVWKSLDANLYDIKRRSWGYLGWKSSYEKCRVKLKAGRWKQSCLYEISDD